MKKTVMAIFTSLMMLMAVPAVAENLPERAPLAIESRAIPAMTPPSFMT